MKKLINKKLSKNFNILTTWLLAITFTTCAACSHALTPAESTSVDESSAATSSSTEASPDDSDQYVLTQAGNILHILPEYDPTVANKNIEYINRFAKESELPLYFGLIPSSAEILSDQLPADAVSLNEEAMINTLYDACDESLIHKLDVRSALLDHKEEYIFYRTDHHWTSLGACYGANALLEAMNENGSDFKQFDPIKSDKKTVTDSFYGRYYEQAGITDVKADEIDTYIPDDDLEVTIWKSTTPQPGRLYVDENLEKDDKYTFFLGGNVPICEIKSKATGPKLMLIRDSYSSCMIPFLTKYFSEIHIFDLRYCRISLKDYAKEHGIEQVAVIYSLKTFMEDSNLVFLKK